MSESDKREFVLPTRMASRRLLAGRLGASMLFFNIALALIGGWALSGPAAGLTRFEFGFPGWVIVLFLASLLPTIPIAGLLIMKLLQPPAE